LGGVAKYFVRRGRSQASSDQWNHKYHSIHREREKEREGEREGGEREKKRESIMR